MDAICGEAGALAAVYVVAVVAHTFRIVLCVLMWTISHGSAAPISLLFLFMDENLLAHSFFEDGAAFSLRSLSGGFLFRWANWLLHSRWLNLFLFRLAIWLKWLWK